jgi:hypothetical protein
LCVCSWNYTAKVLQAIEYRGKPTSPTEDFRVASGLSILGNVMLDVKVYCDMDSACILDHSEEKFVFEIPTIIIWILPPRS